MDHKRFTQRHKEEHKGTILSFVSFFVPCVKPLFYSKQE
jgi:hypothetical protein